MADKPLEDARLNLRMAVVSNQGWIRMFALIIGVYDAIHIMYNDWRPAMIHTTIYLGLRYWLFHYHPKE